MPMSEEWEKFTLESLPIDKKGPVEMTEFDLIPAPVLMRKFISPMYMREKFIEIQELLVYMSSVDSKESNGYGHLADEDSRFYGNVTITMIGGKCERKPGLFIKTQDHMDESFEYALRSALKPLLVPFRRRPEVGFSLSFRWNPVHPKWKAPEKFKDLTF